MTTEADVPVAPRVVRSTRNPVSKAIRVLRWMVDTPMANFGLREIARGTRLPPSTVHRVLTDLGESGLVEIDPKSGRYVFGSELSRIAWKLTARFPLREVALPALQQLVDASNESAFIGVFDRHREKVMFIAAVESTHELRYVVPLHVWTELSFGASTLAILAFLEPAERDRIFKRIAVIEAERGHHADLEEIRRTLDRVRRDGVAISVGSRVKEAIGISAPVFDAQHDVIASLGLSIPLNRDFDVEAVSSMVSFAGQRISTELGASISRSIDRDSHIADVPGDFFSLES